MYDYYFEITDENCGLRVDKLLAVSCEGLSRSYIQKLIKDGKVLLNGQVCKASTVTSEGDRVLLYAPEPVTPDILPQDIPLDILYEDGDVIVVNKPKGMVVHPAPGHYSDTLVNALLYHCSDLSGINGVLRPGIVHRIDRDTTGAIIACKNDRAHEKIAAQLKEHSLDREYRAIVHGNIKEDKGTINAPIGRDRKDRKRMGIDYENGREAVTDYEVLERFGQYTYIKCILETGRTHQIRVHMSHMKHPVLGDEVYSHISSPFKLTGQTLHAATLGFTHPSTGERILTRAPLPEYFERLLKSLRKGGSKEKSI
ncbi:MAG: RluA family pseudouridine synthase [Lachnospiraceae bacterium]|nr:RluA family pseudouridine synthase [Lachnospiraceae bacterium]